MSITDNPGGNAMINPDTLGTDLLARGQEVVIHLSCKDWNRNALQSRGWQLASEGFNNILALSGDFPVGGYQGHASGVFDMDSVGLLKMYSEMNSGMRVNNGNPTRRMESTRFFLGAVVSNHKKHEREVVPQYLKLIKKIENGAGFIVNQIGYDSRKQDELLRYLHLRKQAVPVIANVYVLSLAAARAFHAGKVPGCVVTEELLALVERQAQSPDKGKRFFLEFAARQCVIARGLGFRGVYLGGYLRCEEYEKILEIANTFTDTDWRDFAKEIQYPQAGEFYFFEPDVSSGLNSPEINQEYVRSKTAEARHELKKSVSSMYKLNRVIHNAIFEKGSPGFAIGKKLAQAAERKGPRASQAFHIVEQAFKMPAFDCRDCGDCSLPDIAFLCPESQCAKNERNGPCGGTRDGKCEVGDKECIWALAYDRLKAYGEEEAMLERPVIIKDARLKGTSSWMNTFLEKDHPFKR